MKMKSVLSKGMVALLFFAPFFMFAQQQVREVKKAPETKEERALTQTDRMKKELNLTDDQYKKVYEVNLKHAQEMGSKAESSNREEHEKELKEVLTSEQYQTMRSNAEKRDESLRKQARAVSNPAMESKAEKHETAPIHKNHEVKKSE